jgi:hypothetical protein
MAAGIDLQSLQNEQADTDGACSAAVFVAWTEVMSVAITPTGVSSRVLLLMSGVLYSEGQPDLIAPVTFREAQVGYKVTRQIGAGAETDLVIGDASGSRTIVTGACKRVAESSSAIPTSGSSVTLPYLDAPGTVSAVTYRLYLTASQANTPAREVTLNCNSDTGTYATASFRQGRSSLVVVELM